MKSLIISLLLSSQSVKAALPYNYEDNGKNWEALADSPNACKTGKNQSPINLKTDLTAKETGSFFKHYENVDTACANEEVQKAGYGSTTFKAEKGAQAFYLTLDVNGLAKDGADTGLPTINPASPTWFATPNYFVSDDAATYGGDKQYFAKQLHFHTGSEHTIDGQRKELEMHIVHQSANDEANLRTEANADTNI